MDDLLDLDWNVSSQDKSAANISNASKLTNLSNPVLKISISDPFAVLYEPKEPDLKRLSLYERQSRPSASTIENHCHVNKQKTKQISPCNGLLLDIDIDKTQSDFSKSKPLKTQSETVENNLVSIENLLQLDDYNEMPYNSQLDNIESNKCYQDSDKTVYKFEFDIAEKEFDQGRKFYDMGDYEMALFHYNNCLAKYPNQHPFQILLLIDMAKCSFMKGHLQDSLLRTEQAKSLIDFNAAHSDFITFKDGAQKAQDLFINIYVLKAQILEQLEKHNQASLFWDRILELDHENILAIQGKKRCNSTLKERASKELETYQKLYTTKFDDDSRDKVQAQVNEMMSRWINGKQDNIRALLCSLQDILWRELQWKSVSLKDLITSAKVKQAYYKAVAKIHPDKISSSESLKNRLIAEYSFGAINRAWDIFRNESI